MMGTRASRKSFSSQTGVTLVELVISIVIISIAVTGVLLVIQRNTLSSANPMVTYQSIAIGEAYLEEILLQEFADPTDLETGGPEAGETRATYDDVSDYHNLTDNGARDRTGTAIVGLEDYSVTVSVTVEALGDITQASGNAKRVVVTVTGPDGQAIPLSGYRTNY